MLETARGIFREFLTAQGLNPDSALFSTLGAFYGGWAIAFGIALGTAYIGHLLIGSGRFMAFPRIGALLLPVVGLIFLAGTLARPADPDTAKRPHLMNRGHFVSVSDRKSRPRLGSGGNAWNRAVLSDAGNQAESNVLSRQLQGILTAATGGSVDTERLLEETNQSMQNAMQ